MTETRDKQAEATRTEILDQAHSLFSHYGFSKTNIGDIAKSCGMSPGNLYRYYRNKQAIGLAAVQRYFLEVEVAMDEVLQASGGSPEDRIRAALVTCVQHLLAEFERNPKLVELADFLCNDEEGLEILNAHIAWKRKRIAQEIDRGVADGSLETDDSEHTAAVILTGLKAFWTPMTLALWRDRSTVVPELEAIVDLMFRGLRA